ncbi:MAG: PAS domain-containing protein, partial [Rhodoferax sp.]|nr:PAS domain-containing protein [Rhodoferax sp.]
MPRLLLLSAAAVSLVSGGLLVAALTYLRQEAIKVSEELTDTAALWVEAQTSRTIERVDKRLQLALASLPGQSAAAASAFLASQKEGLPSVTAIRLLGPDGRLVHESGPDAGARDYSGRPFFQNHLSEPTRVLHIGEPVLDRAAGAWVISISRAVRSAAGTLEAVIVADLAPQHFDGLWRTGPMRPGESITLLRRDGVLLARSPRDLEPVGQPIPELSLLNASMARSLAGRFRGNTPDNEPGIYAYRTLSAEPGLVVLVSQSFDRMLAPWRQLAAVAGTVWVLGSGGVVLLCMTLAKAWHQRFRAEAGLEKMAQRLSLATATAGIGIWDWNLRDNQWWASDTYNTMLGYPSDAPTVNYEQWLERIHPEDRPAVDARIQTALNQFDQPYRYEARQRHADGS